ncbi:unnamed protein product [Mytilus coruscus]|uniref:C-type lectin domain-containing protein n=1 Tax=Mytilus coruscus TaxID=42192 RepID=A0A6J8AJC6_MYTCO|nr:unnamed protein product [Mytilus coruscus]
MCEQNKQTQQTDTAPTPPFTVLVYYGTSPSFNVSVINHPVTWQEASQNCFSNQFFELFAESSVNKLLDHLDEVNQMLQQLLWPAYKHLWIGYLYNGTSYLMVDGGKCVTSANLLPIFYTNGGTGCILLNVAATTASDLLYTVPCDEQHEYLCEFPMHVDIDSTRYENMEIDKSYIVGYKIITLVISDSTKCEQAMKSRKMAYAAEFYRLAILCHVYENLVFEFPVNVRIITSYMGATTFVKTAGHTGFPSDPQSYTNPEMPSSSLRRTSRITTAIQTVDETVKTTEEITMETIDVSPTMQTDETTRILTEEIPFHTPEELIMKMTDEISISTTEKVTTLKIGETGMATPEITPSNITAL